jgi:hypothetical protein
VDSLLLGIDVKAKRMGTVDTLHVVNYANDVQGACRLFIGMNRQNTQTL